MYQTSGRVATLGFVINLGLSGYVVFTHYLDNKTVTVFLTNALFMGMKLYDIKSITETDKNIFLSAYLTRKIQYNDVDPDKVDYKDESVNSEVVLSKIISKDASMDNLLVKTKEDDLEKGEMQLDSDTKEEVIEKEVENEEIKE